MKLRFTLRRYFLLMAVLSVASFLFAIAPFGIANAADCGGIETSIVDCSSTNDTTVQPVVSYALRGV